MGDLGRDIKEVRIKPKEKREIPAPARQPERREIHKPRKREKVGA